MDGVKESPFLSEARQIAAQCWCDPETSDREMDVALAEAVAKRIAAWMDSAAEYVRNMEFYRGLVDKCVDNLGHLKPQAFIADDGSVSDSVLRLKVPDLVGQLSGLARQERESMKRPNA